MRRLMVVTAAAAMGYWWYSSRKPKTPVAVNAYQGQATPQPVNTFTPPDYLNFDFEALLFPWKATPKAEPAKKYPLQGDNSMMPKGIANNNPLNIESGANWQGLAGTDGRFAKFDSAFYGIRAAGRTLKTYRNKYGINTVTGIINRWAPPSDNNPTQNYISFVANKAGVNPDLPLSMVDYPQVVAAMIHFENGYNPYEANEIVTAVNAGFA
jgi:hypothetical protein